MGGLGFIKGNKMRKALIFMCLFGILSLAGCGEDNENIVDPAVTGPVETIEASAPPTETVDYRADAPETIETTVSCE